MKIQEYEIEFLLALLRDAYLWPKGLEDFLDTVMDGDRTNKYLIKLATKVFKQG